MRIRTPLAAVSVLLLLAACTPATPDITDDGLNDGTPQQEVTVDEQADSGVEVEVVSSEAASVASQQQSSTEGTRVLPDISTLSSSSTPASSVAAQQPVQAQAGVYTTYNASVLKDGRTKVLFFNASWCPICKIQDQQLREWYAAVGIPGTVYSVDYDSHKELRSTYGVTYQHTFVKVDGQGTLIEKIQGPSESQLRAMLGA